PISARRSTSFARASLASAILTSASSTVGSQALEERVGEVADRIAIARAQVDDARSLEVDAQTGAGVDGQRLMDFDGGQAVRKGMPGEGGIEREGDQRGDAGGEEGPHPGVVARSGGEVAATDDEVAALHARGKAGIDRGHEQALEIALIAVA